ncbi:MAG: hypothetical protein RIE59_20350 [Imperialibacter sp.]
MGRQSYLLGVGFGYFGKSNFETGSTENRIRLEGIAEELYDVEVLKDVSESLFIGTKTENVQTMFWWRKSRKQA